MVMKMVVVIVVAIAVVAYYFFQPNFITDNRDNKFCHSKNNNKAHNINSAIFINFLSR